MVVRELGLAERVDAALPAMANRSPSRDISAVTNQNSQRNPDPYFSVYVRGYPGYGERLRHALEDRAGKAAQRRGASSFLIREETYQETSDINGPYSVAIVDFYKNGHAEPGITPAPEESHQRSSAAVLRSPR
ncbi:hypothetical protein HYS47_00625 [Candidatus Woesearchaeota archaeon]|nr:hypothetical protein [Candidatus Woesearchaeota archaeon]